VFISSDLAWLANINLAEDLFYLIFDEKSTEFKFLLPADKSSYPTETAFKGFTGFDETGVHWLSTQGLLN